MIPSTVTVEAALSAAEPLRWHVAAQAHRWEIPKFPAMRIAPLALRNDGLLGFARNGVPLYATVCASSHHVVVHVERCVL